jgi:hypothetical protein
MLIGIFVMYLCQVQSARTGTFSLVLIFSFSAAFVSAGVTSSSGEGSEKENQKY